METYLAFLSNHPVLTAAFFLLIAAIIVVELKDRLTGPKKLSPHELTQVINRENALVIDIRDADAFKKGHIVEAKNIAKDMVNTKHKELQKNRDKPVIVLDENGFQAGPVANKLLSEGLSNVYLLKGGIQAWQHEQLPLVKKK